MMNNLVSIIIPTFNSSVFLQQTLDSVLVQNYTHWECILVDDGSIDATETITANYQKKDSRFYAYSRPVNLPKGPSSARNFGLKQAQGKYVIFLDSDDVLAVTCLEQRVHFANINSNYDWWIFKMNMFETVPNTSGKLFNVLPNIDNELLFYKKEFYSGKFPFAVTCPLWKRSSLIALEGFDESMRMLEDPDLHLRALKLGMKPKTAKNLVADCFYRIINNKERAGKRQQYNAIAAKSNIYFLKKHYLSNNTAIKHNYKRIYNLYVFAAKSFSNNINLIQFGIKNNILPLKQILVSYLILMLAKLGANKIKGSGYHLLRQFFNNF